MVNSAVSTANEEPGAVATPAEAGPGSRRGGKTAHRAPSPEERLRDAERSRRLLLEAALDEFAAKGYAGARTIEIAARAGVNRQLISYYFGGKEGLYRELQGLWLDHESNLTEQDLPLADAVVQHLHDALADPRLLRLGLWRGLTDSPGVPAGAESDHDDLSRTRSRQASGELAMDLDPAAVLLLLIGAVAIPVAMPQLVTNIFGIDPSDPAFESRYAAQLRQIIGRLAVPAPTPRPDELTTGDGQCQPEDKSRPAGLPDRAEVERHSRRLGESREPQDRADSAGQARIRRNYAR